MGDLQLTDGKIPEVFDLKKSIDLLLSGDLTEKESNVHKDQWNLVFDTWEGMDWRGEAAALLAEYKFRIYGITEPLKKSVAAANPYVLGTDRGREIVCDALRESSDRAKQKHETALKHARAMQKVNAWKMLKKLPIYSASGKPTACEKAGISTDMEADYLANLHKKRQP